MIKIKSLNKQFGSDKDDAFHALKNINLEIKCGEVVVINGISGSGKSTLLSIIGAIMKPTSGAVEVDGNNIVSFSDFHASAYRQHRVGFITQTFHLFDAFSVKENLFAALSLTDLSTKEIQIRVDRDNSLNFIEIVKKLKEMNKIVIIATHDPLFNELDFVDRVVYMKDGELE